MSYLQFLNTTRCCVVGAVDFVVPGNLLTVPIEEISQPGKFFRMCLLNCSLFLKPVKCFTTINNSANQSLNNFRFLFGEESET